MQMFEIKNKIKAINSGKESNYGKDYMKITFDSDGDLPLNELLKFHVMVRIIRSVFEEDDKLYPQLLLDDTLWIIKMLQYERVDVSEGIDVDNNFVKRMYALPLLVI